MHPSIYVVLAWPLTRDSHRTRKIKEVDFGFSLGLGAPAEESSQPASQPTNNDLKPAPAPQPPLLDAPPLVPAPSTADVIQTQSTPSPTRTNAFGASRDQPVRTPGSARNKLPPRRSTFDIPPDDEPELERSSKRRRIGTFQLIAYGKLAKCY